VPLLPDAGRLPRLDRLRLLLTSLPLLLALAEAAGRLPV